NVGPAKSAAPVGFQQLTIESEANEAIPIGLWYPTSTPPKEQPLALFSQVVAQAGIISGTHLSLVVISHGTGGSLASHYDTAHALAAAGFVVAALTHPGDNSQDQRLAGSRRDLIDRPRDVHRVLDYVLSEWVGHNRVDATRVGIFGFSLGGFTSLVAVGGAP